MATQAELEAITDAAAANAKSTSVDGVSVQQQDLSQLIALERFRAEQTAAAGSTMPIRIFKTKPPGAV